MQFLISPHKFLGAPGTPGILIINSEWLQNTIPDNTGGGTVVFTNPWKQQQYHKNIETREYEGTPSFLQGIKAVLAFQLKQKMGVNHIMAREQIMVQTAMDALNSMDEIYVFE
jgi:Selenocysteine lyase